MNGMFNIKLFDNRGLKDGAFEKAIEGNYLMEQLDDLPVERHLPSQQNRIFDNLANMHLHTIFSGPNPGGTWTYLVNNSPSNHAAIAFINLSTDSSVPTGYTEDWTSDTNVNSISNVTSSANTSSGSKRFIEDDITAPTIWSDTAREAIHFRNRFLWLPSQGNSSSIRSVAIYAHEDADNTSRYYLAVGKVGRVRLRDADGVLTTLNKTSSNSLLVEYTFTLVTW
jgi:hypothetical protein